MLKSDYNLDTITKLMSRLGNPQDTLRCIHVAGTNGKGSTVAFLTEILRAAGNKAGAYTSPALSDDKENICINGKQITESDFARLSEVVQNAGQPDLQPSLFEIETAVAFLYFKEQAVDYAVIECGMGGRFDATNVLKMPALAVITSISLDHTNMLGRTLEEIRSHKEGIIKGNCPVVRADTLGEITVEKSDTEEQIFSCGSLKSLKIHMWGTYQPQNACLAAAAAQKLGIAERYIREGLESARWEGRLTVLRKAPLFIVDGAHNAGGAEELYKTLSALGKKVIFVTGIFRDKAADEMIRTVAPLAKKIVLIDMPENKRLYRASELREIVIKYIDNPVMANSPADAVQKALAAADEDDVIVSFGSLSTVSAVTEAVKKYQG